MQDARRSIALWRWVGPVLAIGGIVLLAYLETRPYDVRGRVAWWLMAEAQSYRRLLPLIGLGAAFALLPRRLGLLAFVAFGLGLMLGTVTGAHLIAALNPVAGGSKYYRLVGPAAFLAAGIALVPPPVLRRYMAPLAAVAVGVAFTVFVRLTDPSFNDPLISRAGALFALWVTASVGLCVAALQQNWFDIAGRILGSWLIAIGLLYGGAVFVPKKPPSVAPVRPQQQRPMRPAIEQQIVPLPGAGTSGGVAAPPDLGGRPLDF